MIINTQLWKDVVKVLKAALASYTGPNRDHLLAMATSAAYAAARADSASASRRCSTV